MLTRVKRYNVKGEGCCRKRDAYIRAYKVHHIKHILYVSESIGFTDNKLNLVIRCFNPGIAHTIADCI